MTEAPALETLAAREIVAAHRFFVAWFRGEDPMPAEFANWQSAFAPDFRMVTPDGALHDRAAILGRIETARNSAPPDFAIDISGIETIHSSAEACLLIYVERQYRDGKTTERRSTALFSRDSKAPRGVSWRHLQETWMQGVGTNSG